MTKRHPGSVTRPRNSKAPNPPMTPAQRAYWDRLHGDAAALRDLMARAMCPDEWAEYDAGNGVCSNMAGWACLESISHASRAYRALIAAGVPLPEPPRDTTERRLEAGRVTPSQQSGPKP